MTARIRPHERGWQMMLTDDVLRRVPEAIYLPHLAAKLRNYHAVETRERDPLVCATLITIRWEVAFKERLPRSGPRRRRRR